MISRADLREFLLGLPGANRDRIEIGLAHPQGLQTMVPGLGNVAFLRHGDTHEYEVVENFDIDAYNESLSTEREKTAITKELQNMLEPTMIIIPLIHDAKSPAPLGPKKALTLTQEILLKRGTIISPTNREPFHGTQAEIDSIVTKALAANPGARLASEPKPRRRYISAQADEQIAKRCSEDPSFRAVESAQAIVKTGAEPVQRPRVAGTISRESYRESIRSSEDQARESHTRVRATQRSDGSFSPVGTTTPHEPLSMSRRPEDRDRHPGLASYPLPTDLSGVERRLVKGVEARVCEVNGCETRFASATRRRCQDHAMTDRGQGIKGK